MMTMPESCPIERGAGMRETWTNRAKTDWMADAGEGHATVDRVG